MSSMIKVFQYLRRQPKDIMFINGLFVTAFLKWNGLASLNNSVVAKYLFSEEAGLKQVDEFLELLLVEEREFSLETLINLFEFVVSPADKKVDGSVYTPMHIRKTIIDRCFLEVSNCSRNTRIADIACGCGGFLMDASQKLHQLTNLPYKVILENCIFGVDIQSYSIERTKILLSLAALLDGEDADYNFRLFTHNALDFDFANALPDFSGFDMIVGNPPYVCSRNIPQSIKDSMNRWSVCSVGHPDLYIPFFQVAFVNLKHNGILGYITMNSFLKSLNGKALRCFFQEIQPRIEILDFRGKQIFKKRSAYTCLFYLKKQASKNIYYAINDEQEYLPSKSRTEIDYQTLDPIKGWTLNCHNEILIYEQSGIPIKEYCKTSHGIATLSNKTYVFKPSREDESYYYMQRGNTTFKIERAICRNIVNSNKLNNDLDISSMVEKVIFPYKPSDDGRVSIIEESDLASNFPNAYFYLLGEKSVLDKRDKGQTNNYASWYAYGRTQSLSLPYYKLLFPKIANRPLHCELIGDSSLMLYNGMAFVSKEKETLQILQKVLESELFWNYVITNGKPYRSGFYSLNGSNIIHFCIPKFSDDEKDVLINLIDKSEIEIFLRGFYV